MLLFQAHRGVGKTSVVKQELKGEAASELEDAAGAEVVRGGDLASIGGWA
jgi:hypothetical protein